MWFPGLFAVERPLETPPLGSITRWDAGCPQAVAANRCCHLASSKPCFAATLWDPQSIFGHPYPGRHNLPVSPSPFLPSGDWHGLTLGPCPVSPQGDSPGTTAPSGRGHASPSPGQLSGRAASIRRKLQTSGGWWGTVVPLCALSAWPGSLHQRRLLPPALSQPDTGRQSLCGGAS